MSQRSQARSMYLVTYSDVNEIAVGDHLVDKGVQPDRCWEFISFETGAMTSVFGERIARLCPHCYAQFDRATLLGHDGECSLEVPAASRSFASPTPRADEQAGAS